MYELSSNRPLDTELDSIRIAYSLLYDAYDLRQVDESKFENTLKLSTGQFSIEIPSLIQEMIAKGYIHRVNREAVPETSEMFKSVRAAVNRLYVAPPKLSMYYVDIAARVNGESHYYKKVYSIRLLILKTTRLSEAIAIMCHEAGHIKLDELSGTPGAHIHYVPIEYPEHLAKEVDAWISGMNAAKLLNVRLEYILYARSIITPRDEAKMHKPTLEKWKKFLYENR